MGGGVDKAEVAAKIREMSKNSKFYRNEQRKEEKLQRRIAAMKDKMQMIREREEREQQMKAPSLTPSPSYGAFAASSSVRGAKRPAHGMTAGERAKASVDQVVQAMEGWRDLNRVYAHVDMDAFYASVEMRDNAELRDVPMAVGGPSMLSTSNYKARQFGVRSGMPGFIAKELCPDLVVVRPNFVKYKEASAQAHSVFYEYDPDARSYSLDEASLDLTPYLRREHLSEFPPPGSQQTAEMRQRQAERVVAIVDRIRQQVTVRTNGLTCSAGIAPNRPLAKVGADMNKPNGTFSLLPATRASILEFVGKLPVRKVSGIGKVSEKMLSAVGVSTCGELFAQRYLVWQLFTSTMALNFLRLSMGLGRGEVHLEELEGNLLPAKRKAGGRQAGGKRKRQSMSKERTFRKMTDQSQLLDKLAYLATGLEECMEKAGLLAKCVTVKMKSDEFEVKQRSKTLDVATREAKVVFRIAAELFREGPRLPLRLIGIKLSALEAESKTEDAHTTTDITSYFGGAKKRKYEAESDVAGPSRNEEERDDEDGREEEGEDDVEVEDEEEDGDDLEDVEMEERGGSKEERNLRLIAASELVEELESEERLSQEVVASSLDYSSLYPEPGQRSAVKEDDVKEEEEEEEESMEEAAALAEAKPDEAVPATPLVDQPAAAGTSTAAPGPKQPESVREAPPLPPMEQAECPVCFKHIFVSTQAVLLHHIDRCLAKSQAQEEAKRAKEKEAPSVLRYFSKKAQ